VAKSASRAPNTTGIAPKRRGGRKELTKGLGTEEEAPVKEIEAERRSSGGSFGAAALHVRGREEEWRGVKRRPWGTFYR
jgi:hypothetical protein